jgi:hypothetical protein
MAETRRTSPSTVAATHVVVTGVIVPLVANAVVVALAAALRDRLSPTVIFSLACIVLAAFYIAGTAFMLLHFRATAVLDHPIDCVQPAVVGFSLIMVVWFLVDVALIQHFRLSIIGFALFYALIASACGEMIHASFHKMAEEPNHALAESVAG